VHPKPADPQDTVETHDSKGSTVGSAGGDGVPISGTAVAVGTAALDVVTGDGSLTHEVSLVGDANVTAGATTVGDPAASTGPAGRVSPSAAVADDDVTVEESRGILGHPIRALEDVFLDEAMGTTRWALTQAQDVLRQESGGINDEWRLLLLWASKLKERTTTEKARVEARR
jgi:hypothetical protein